MRLAMITSWFYPFPAGSANRFYEIARRLSGKHEIHVFTTRLRGREREENIEGISVHRYGIIDPSWSLEKGMVLANLKFSWNTLRRLSRGKAFKDFDLIDCNITSKSLPFVSYIASRFLEIPLVETWHEVWHLHNFKQYNFAFSSAAFVAEPIMARLADRFIAVSETTKQRLVDLLGAAEHKVEVIPNGVDTKAFEKADGDKKRFRIIYAGRLENHKRVDLLLLAFKELKKTLPECELCILGDGSQRTSLVNLSSRLGLRGVHFLGVVPRLDLISWIKSSAILVLPSVLEGQGIVLLEAMAAGTPPVAVWSQESGVKDVVKDGFNGLLVRSAVDEITGAMHKLLTTKSLYERLQRNGLDFVKRYDWSHITDKAADFYERVAQAR